MIGIGSIERGTYFIFVYVNGIREITRENLSSGEAIDIIKTPGQMD